MRRVRLSLWILFCGFTAIPRASAGGGLDDFETQFAKLKADYPDFADAFDAELRKDASKLETIATFRKHQGAIASFDPAKPDTVEAAAAALRELYAGGEKGNFENVHWILQKSTVIDEAHSKRISDIRNHMVDAALREMAVLLGEVCKVDFSPSKHALNDIDQTFRVLEPRKIPGTVQKRIFEYLFQRKWGIAAPHMDVVSHPEEARIPDWRKTGVSRSDFIVQLKKGSALLKNNSEAYFLEGAFRMQVERRAFDAENKLVAIYTHNARTGRHGPVLEVHDAPRAGDVDVRAERVDQFVYRMRRPEARATYGWGASVGNWWFFHHHGEGVRFASKYGLRSFAESLGWLVQLSNPAFQTETPKTYEELQDATLKEGIFNEVYDKYYGGLGLAKADLHQSLLTAKAIRDAKDKYGEKRAAILRDLAVAAAGGEKAYAANPEAFHLQAEARVEEHLKRMMLHNIELSLPDRAKDWLRPVVDPRILGYTEEQIKQDGPELKKAVKDAERRLSRSALFELVLGLNQLPPEIRDAAVSRLRERHKHDAVFDYGLGKLLEMSSKDIVGWLQAEAGKPGPKRKALAIDPNTGLAVDKPAADMEAAARGAEKVLLDDAQAVLAELRKAGLSDLDPSEVRVLESQKIVAPRGSPEFQRARASSRMAKLLAVEAALMKTTGGRLLTRPVGDWRLIEELDFSQGLVPRANREAMLNQVLDWGNVDSVINVLRAFYEYRKDPEQAGALLGMFRTVAWEIVSMVFPILNTATAMVEAAQGNLAPGMLIGVGLAVPQLGMAIMAYNVASNAWTFFVEVGTDRQVDLHYQGKIPSKAGDPPRQSDVADVEMPDGILFPVFQDLKRVRKEIQARRDRTIDLELRSRFEQELAVDLPEDIKGVETHLFNYFQASLDARLKPAATPIDEWHQILLAGGDPVAGGDNDFANLPRRLVNYFGRQVDDYLAGRGKYEKFKAALDHPVIRENYLCSEDGKRAFAAEGFRERLIGALVLAYRDVLRSRIQGGKNLAVPAEFPKATTEKPLDAMALIQYCLEGRKGDQLLDRGLKRGPYTGEVPDLPSLLDPVPGATYPEKIANFFAHHDGALTAALRARKEKGLEVPPEEQWDRWKLGLDDAEQAPDKGDARHLKFTPIQTFFREEVNAYRSRTSGSLPAGLDETQLRQRLADQLTLAYKASLLKARQKAAEQQQRDAAERRIQYHAKLNKVLELLAGNPDAATRKRGLLDLAHHSGDPFAATEDLDEFVRGLAAADPPGAEIKILPPAAGIAPGKPLLLQCEVRASRHYARPFTYAWSLSTAGKSDAAKEGGLGGLFVGRVLDLGPNLPQAYTISLTVKDARGVAVGATEITLPSGVAPPLVPTLTAQARRPAGDAPFAGYDDFGVLFHYKHRDWRDPLWNLEDFAAFKRGATYRFPVLYRIECDGDRTFQAGWNSFTPGARAAAPVLLPGQADEGTPATIYVRAPGRYKARVVAFYGPGGKSQSAVEFDVEMREPGQLPSIRPEDVAKRLENLRKGEEGTREQWAQFQRTRRPEDLRSTLAWFDSQISGLRSFYGDAYLVKNWRPLLRQYEAYAAPYGKDYVAMAAANVLRTKLTLLGAGKDLAEMEAFAQELEACLANRPQKERDAVLSEARSVFIGPATRYARDYMDNERAEAFVRRLEGLTPKYETDIKRVREHYESNTTFRSFFPADAFK